MKNTDKKIGRSRREDRAASWVLITGASSGIGAAFARHFAAEGYSLILTARRLERLIALRSELGESLAGGGSGVISREKRGPGSAVPLEKRGPGGAISLEKRGERGAISRGKSGLGGSISPETTGANGQRILLIPADLSRTQEVYHLFREIGDRELRVLVNNAGFGECGDFLSTDAEKELAMIDVNVKAMHLVLKLGLQRMRHQSRGTILNVGSSAGLLPAGPYMSAYYATKAYVVSLTRGVAEELRESGSPLYVAALCPGPVNTEFNEVAGVRFALPGITPEECVRCAVKQMRRRRTIIVPESSLRLAVLGGKLLPATLITRITARQQQKKL